MSRPTLPGEAERPYSYPMHLPADRLHSLTGLALEQPRGLLITDADLVALASAESMFHGHTTRELLAAAGIEHEYTLPRKSA